MKPLYFLFIFLSIGLSLSKRFEFHEDGSFTILQLTDLHLCNYPNWDNVTHQVIRDLIKATEPDLVIITGDVVARERQTLFTGFYEKAWRALTQIFNETKTYYALTLGNHDLDLDLTAEQILDMDMAHPYSATEKNLFTHPATYTIPIFSRINPENISANLWFFDTGSYGCAGNRWSYGCVEEDQIEWYNSKSSKLKEVYGTSAQHIAFLHIPLPEYMDLYNSYTFYGGLQEKVCCPFHNTGLLSAIKKNGDISAVFCGHDHLNNYGGFLDGIELVYGRKTGRANSGPPVGIQRGGRVIKLYEEKGADGTIRTYREHFIVNADGTFEFNKMVNKRTGPKQIECMGAYGHSKSFYTRIMVGIITGAILAIVLLVCFVSCLVSKKKYPDPEKAYFSSENVVIG